MNTLIGSHGFDRSEMIPPVPAPRYKRKLITKEDSKYASNKQNTTIIEQTEILPPPRRKHKLRSIKKTDSNKNSDSDEQNNKPSSEGIQLISNSEEKPPISCNEHAMNDNMDPNNEDCKNVLEGEHTETSEMTDAFSKILGSSILMNFINDRVLDIPLESNEHSRFIRAEQTTLTQDNDVDNREENRVNNSLTENSATIVGVFYKPEYSLTLANGNRANSNVNSESDSTVWSFSFVSGNKENVVPPIEPEIVKAQMNKKDSEEDDSGVYFSDTKSPPHRNNDTDVANKENRNETDTSCNLQISSPFTCNDRDTFDNNSSELGPNMYNEVLDSFEAQTVSALREEVTGRLSLCSELGRHEAVESWLNGRDYPTKRVINSNLSEYLRNMLEVEGSERSLSPYPLSTVDESSDVSEKGIDIENDRQGQSRTSEACTVPSSLSETRENRNVVISDNYSCSFVDTASVNYVNNECTEVTSSKSIPLLETPKSIMEDFETSYAGQLRKSGEIYTSQDKLFFKETSHPESVSPSIEHGVVNKLITFFEAIHTDDDFDQEDESENKNEINDAVQDGNIIEQDSCFINNPLESADDSKIEIEINNCNVESLEDKPIEFSNTSGDINEETPENQHQREENCIFKDAISTSFYSKSESISVMKLNLETETLKTDQEINQCNLPSLEVSTKMMSDDSKKDIDGYNSIEIEDSFNWSNLYDENNQLNKKTPKEFSDHNILPVILDKVPNCNISTKDKLQNDDTFRPFKPTRIPVVVFTEADTSSPVGSVELHPSECLSEDDDTTDMAEEMFKENSLTHVNEKDVSMEIDCESEKSLENAVTVVLEKNWGSIGLKIRGDGTGVVISEILVGGAADQSGLVFKGHLSPEKKTRVGSLA